MQGEDAQPYELGQLAGVTVPSLGQQLWRGPAYWDFTSEGMASAFAHGSAANAARRSPAPQEISEVCLQVGEVGDVGAEVLAPHALEPDGAVVPAGGDIGGLGAEHA
ncbi:hypothetical protein ACFO9E_05665 [Streptomyces maoxianensis]|uniref:Uncharacterized protein n=1 Tax=Streptomyces maoxianensis TaxID=1459942 RepID=A0ABV9G3A1_9ACTN